MSDILKNVTTVFIIIFTLTAYGLMLWYLGRPGEWARKIAETHFPTLIGIPVSTVVALFIVILLHTVVGPIEFKALGFEFSGASGPVILWVVCLLALIIAIRITWNLK